MVEAIRSHYFSLSLSVVLVLLDQLALHPLSSYLLTSQEGVDLPASYHFSTTHMTVQSVLAAHSLLQILKK